MECGQERAFSKTGVIAYYLYVDENDIEEKETLKMYEKEKRIRAMSLRRKGTMGISAQEDGLALVGITDRFICNNEVKKT